MCLSSPISYEALANRDYVLFFFVTLDGSVSDNGSICINAGWKVNKHDELGQTTQLLWAVSTQKKYYPSEQDRGKVSILDFFLRIIRKYLQSNMHMACDQ